MSRILLPVLPLFAACGGSLVGGVDIITGDCEGSPYGKSFDTAAPEPEVWAEADGSTILLHLDDLTANCCPDPDADVTRDEFEITVAFDDLKSGWGCDCMCIMDFTVEISGNDPGTYDIDVLFHEAELGSTTVDVT